MTTCISLSYSTRQRCLCWVLFYLWFILVYSSLLFLLQCERDMCKRRCRHCLQVFQSILSELFKHRQEAGGGLSCLRAYCRRLVWYKRERPHDFIYYSSNISILHKHIFTSKNNDLQELGHVTRYTPH